MLKISDISIERLKNNELIRELPEFYELKEVIENSDWHNNESTFNHTISVLEELEELLENVPEGVKSYLNQTIDKNTRSQLLFLGAVFHDIAKKETYTKNRDLISFPEHEEEGSKRVKNILRRIDLSENEADIVIQIVRHHGDIHPILKPGNKRMKEEYNQFKSRFSDIFLELVLMAMADTLGGQLKDNLPDEFEFRMDFYRKIIDNY